MDNSLGMMNLADKADDWTHTYIAYQKENDIAKRNQKMAQQNAKYDFNLAMEGQMLSARNQVESLENAGLSPAFADGGNGPSGISTKQNATSTPTPFNTAPKGVDVALAKKQMALLDAQAANVREDTLGKQIGNNRDMSEDATFNANLSAYLEQMAANGSPGEQSAAMAMLDCGREFDAGTIKGLQQWRDFNFEFKEQAARSIQLELQKAIESGQLKNSKVVDSLVKMPGAEFSKVINEISELQAITAKLNEETKNLLPAQTAELKAKTQELLKQVQIMTNNDTIGAIVSGDGKLVLAHIATAVGQTALDAGAAMVTKGASAKASMNQLDKKQQHETEMQKREHTNQYTRDSRKYSHDAKKQKAEHEFQRNNRKRNYYDSGVNPTRKSRSSYYDL